MKIALVGVGDFNQGFQSGRPRAVHRELRERYEVVTISLPNPTNLSRALGALDRRLPVGLILTNRSEPLVRRYHKLVAAAVKEHRPDFVLSTTSLPFYRPFDVPAVAWPDAPLNLMLGDPAYPLLNRLSAASQARYLALEARSLGNQSLVAMPTERGMNAARLLSASPAAAVVAPFGPNIDTRVLDEIRHRREGRRRDTSRFRILFSGLDWHRKGGPVALAAVEELNRRGYKSELVVLGVQRDDAASSPARFVGRISIDDLEDRAQYVHEMTMADVFFFPTRADNYGAVLMEAARAGIPVVTSAAAGAAEHVARHRFGLVVGSAANGEREALLYADALERMLTDDETMAAMSTAGAASAQTTLNYGVSAERIARAALR